MSDFVESVVCFLGPNPRNNGLVMFSDVQFDNVLSYSFFFLKSDFVQMKSAFLTQLIYGHPVYTDIFYSPFSVRILTRFDCTSLRGLEK